MLAFFRKLRYQLMEQNKTTRYLKYAFGEIILVVIGILIALQINNWNQKRIEKSVEQATLQALFSEFKENRAALDKHHKDIKEVRAHADTLRHQLGPQQTDYSVDRINWLIGQIGETSKAVVSVDVLDDIRTSGKLNLIRNEAIRKAISKWSSQLKNLQSEEYDWAQEFSSQFVPYTNKWIQWDDVDYLYNYKDSTRYYKSRFKVDPRTILQQPEFANILSIHYWRYVRIELRVHSMLRQTDSVLVKLEHELKQ